MKTALICGWWVTFVCLVRFEVYFWFSVMSQVKNNKKAKGPQWILTSSWSISTTKEVTFLDVESHSWLPGREPMLQARWVGYKDRPQYQRREWKPGNKEQVQKVGLNEWPGARWNVLVSETASITTWSMVLSGPARIKEWKDQFLGPERNQSC